MSESSGMEVALRETGLVVTLEDVANAAWVIPYDEPNKCAITLDQIRKLEALLSDLKHDLSNALQFESQRQGSKTLHLADDLVVEIKTNNVIVWNYDELKRLLEAGLPKDRYDALVVEKTTKSVSVREADKISKANPVYAEIIKAARRPLEAKHSVSVVRS